MAYTAIDDPELYFQTKIYTGNNTDDTAITLDGSEDMAPNLVWIKERDDTNAHYVFDSVRGIDKQLQSNANAAEYDYSGDAGRTVKSFDSDGYTLGTGAGVNGSGELFVAWCWKESATAGFDIVSYTGTGSAKTEAHSLSAVPHLMIFKNRTSSSTNWLVYHHKTSTSPEDDYLTLETTDAVGATTSFLDDTAPTSSVFTVGANNNVNESSSAQITYLWTAKQGFSKFGSFEGNSNADGSYIHLGFSPAFFLWKNIDSAGSWIIVDNKRPGINVINDSLNTNNTNAENTVTVCDFTSNGVKFRTNADHMNGSYTFIYMAFAEAPFVNSNGVPCNAR